MLKVTQLLVLKARREFLEFEDMTDLQEREAILVIEVLKDFQVRSDLYKNLNFLIVNI